MLGLAVIVIGFAYFALLYFAVIGTYFYTMNKGKGKRRAVFRASIVFGIIFLPVFWDTIPTKVMYHRYCVTQAGVTQYKTLEQWRAENPGVYENLYHYTYEDRKEREHREKNFPIARNGKTVNVFTMTTPRFGMYSYSEDLSFSIRKTSTEFIDVETGEIIAKRVRFGAGPGNVFGTGGVGYKFWLNEPPCGDENHAFSKITYEFEKLEPDYAPRG